MPTNTKQSDGLVTEPQQQAVLRDTQGKFMPGVSGNPGGTPKGTFSLQAKLRRYLEEHPSEADDIIKAMAKQGKLGNMVATKEMMDRIDGKVPETHRIEGELPIRLVFMPAIGIIGKTPDEIASPDTKLLPETTDNENL